MIIYMGSLCSYLAQVLMLKATKTMGVMQHYKMQRIKI